MARGLTPCGNDVNANKLAGELKQMSSDTNFLDAVIALYGNGKDHLSKDDFMCMCQGTLGLFGKLNPEEKITQEEFVRLSIQISTCYPNKDQNGSVDYEKMVDICQKAKVTKLLPADIVDDFNAGIHSNCWNVIDLKRSIREKWVQGAE
ncbi:hypothetical protein Ciccas_007586 [Cichlidogyrus casuarinus]|uniref:Uncharacterized protein n=1 Tax=Cichlidogyrus casuarinus TaxID=1844966 RepID=A0ABD2Q2M7_9PLAT